MAGSNAHLMLIYNFHQIGENWLRIGWELSESWNYFLLGHIEHIFENITYITKTPKLVAKILATKFGFVPDWSYACELK